MRRRGNSAMDMGREGRKERVKEKSDEREGEREGNC